MSWKQLVATACVVLAIAIGYRFLRHGPSLVGAIEAGLFAIAFVVILAVRAYFLRSQHPGSDR